MVLQFMKKLENFTNSLSILAEADFKLAESNDIYRTGIIGQFNLTFELAWKALQEIMRMHSVEVLLPVRLVKSCSLVIKLDLSMILRCGCLC